MSEQLTPTQRVKNNIAHNQAYYRLDMVDSHIALELANELERVKEDLSGRTVSCDACNQTAIERDQLKRQVEIWKQRCDPQLDPLFRELEQLRAQNAEFVKDKERLNKIESEMSKALGSDFVRKVEVSCYKGGTIRQAIDEARA